MNFIEANGVSLRYAVRAPASRIVLIHEMGGTHGKLGPGGANRSPPSGASCATTRAARASRRKSAVPLTIDTMTDDLIALLDGLGISEKVALAGTAVGGAIALHTALSFSGSRRGGDRDQPGDLHAADEPRALRLRASTNSNATACASPSRRPPRTAIRRVARRPARFEACRARWLANDPASFAAIYRMLADMDLTPELPSIKCPVLVIGGEFDRGRPPRVVEPIAKAIPGASSRCCRPATSGLADAGAGRDGDRRVSST